jgi:hypothetical protein
MHHLVQNCLTPPTKPSVGLAGSLGPWRLGSGISWVELAIGPGTVACQWQSERRAAQIRICHVFLLERPSVMIFFWGVCHEFFWVPLPCAAAQVEPSRSNMPSDRGGWPCLHARTYSVILPESYVCRPLSGSGETRRKIWWIWCFRRNDDDRSDYSTR